MVKSKLAVSAIGAMLMAGLAAPAAAEFGFTTNYARGLQDMKMMKMMDADANHKVTREEFMKHQEAMFDKMDKNRDGTIDEEEWKARIFYSKG